MRAVDGPCEFVHRVVNQVGRANDVLLHGLDLLTQVVVTLEVPREFLPLELLKV